MAKETYNTAKETYITAKETYNTAKETHITAKETYNSCVEHGIPATVPPSTQSTGTSPFAVRLSINGHPF